MNPQKTGLLLKQMRESKQIGIKEVADRFNVTEEIVCDWEKGDSLPNHKDIPIICSMYGITIDELYKGKIQSKRMSKKNADILVLLSSAGIVAGILSFVMLRMIDLEVAILSGITFITIGVATLLYVGLKTE